MADRALHFGHRVKRHASARTACILVLAFAFLLVLGALVHSRAGSTSGDGDRPIVLVAPLKGTVDLGLAPFVGRIIDEAERDGADAVVLEIDTFGGRLDAGVLIRDRLLASRVRTVAFVHPRAISAGALVALSAETIVMSGGSTIGAATPVQLQPGGSASAVDEKTVSYVRKEFRATAERRGRPAQLAEAMVDADVDVPNVAPAGKLLTLTGDQAVEFGIADLRADDLPALLRVAGLDRAEVRERSMNWAERAASAITIPLVGSILMTLGMAGLMIELRTPGIGVPGIVGFVCLALFLGGHWVVHLAGFEELLLVGVGLVLIVVEVFVTPGFGLAGVLGLAALLGGLGLSLLGSGATVGALVASLGRVAISFVAAIAAVVALLALLPRVPIAGGFVLTAGESPLATSSAEPTHSWVGACGRATTPLRPSGTATFAGERVDVVTEGDFVKAGVAVEVLRHEGSRVVVRTVAKPRSPEREAPS